jgi:malonyl-CoA/methylmalonyl-CoA synthetase
MPTLMDRARDHADREAIVSEGTVYTYRELMTAANGVSRKLLAGKGSLREARIAFIVPPSFANT